MVVVMLVIVRRKKIKEDIINWSVSLLSNEISCDTFLKKFKESKRHLDWFNEYARKHLYSSLKDIDQVLINIKDNVNVRLFLYQLIERFLVVENQEYQIKVEEYSIYKDILEQCPDWVQPDLNIFNSIYSNLKEYLINHTFKEHIEEDFKYIDYKPEWLQNPDWPVIEGAIYIFKSQTMKLDEMPDNIGSIEYIFINPTTKEELKIIQHD